MRPPSQAEEVSPVISENARLSHAPVADRPFDIGQSFGRSWALPQTLTWTPMELSAGQILYREGCFSDRLFAIGRGIVKLVAHMPNGRVRIFGLHGRGAVLGLVTPASACTTYNHTAIAVTTVDAEWAPLAQLRRIRRQCSEEYLQLVERHCEELKNAERWITEFSADTITCRIARVIRYLAELQQLPEPDAVELLTCQEMAEVIGVSTESASRVLARFKRLGILKSMSAEAGSRHYRFDAATLDDIAFT
jgi:CRP-like cAMP-binding protein